MVNRKPYINPISLTEKEADEIRKKNKFLYKVAASGVGLGILAYATESLVRHIGGAEYLGLAQQIFEFGNFLSFSGLFTATFTMLDESTLDTIQNAPKERSLEERATSN